MTWTLQKEMCIRDRLIEVLRTGDAIRKKKMTVYGVTNCGMESERVYRGPVSYTHLDVYKRQKGNKAFICDA